MADSDLPNEKKSRLDWLFTKNKSNTSYVMVSRKLIMTWLFSKLVMIILIIVSFQYANYVDRKSNQQLCEVINLFNDIYKDSPPPSTTGQKIAIAMLKLSKQKRFSCAKI